MCDHCNSGMSLDKGKILCMTENFESHLSWAPSFHQYSRSEWIIISASWGFNEIVVYVRLLHTLWLNNYIFLFSHVTLLKPVENCIGWLTTALDFKGTFKMSLFKTRNTTQTRWDKSFPTETEHNWVEENCGSAFSLGLCMADN